MKKSIIIAVALITGALVTATLFSCATSGTIRLDASSFAASTVRFTADTTTRISLDGEVLQVLSAGETFEIELPPITDPVFVFDFADGESVTRTVKLFDGLNDISIYQATDTEPQTAIPGSIQRLQNSYLPAVFVNGGPFLMGDNEMEFAGWEYNFETGWTRKPGITWSEPGYRNDGEYPVTVVSWYDAAAFCNWLSGRDGLTPAYEITGTGPAPEIVWDTAANGWRLPTEAEWEFVSRGGSVEAHSAARFGLNASGRPGKSSTLPPDSLGISDLSGNAYEWCWDWYEEPYSRSATANPQGPRRGEFKVRRGGSWLSSAFNLDSASRSALPPGYANNATGFRPVRNAP